MLSLCWYPRFLSSFLASLFFRSSSSNLLMYELMLMQAFLLLVLFLLRTTDVNYTGDSSILKRALPLVDVRSRFLILYQISEADSNFSSVGQAEQQWWQTNRTFTVTSPYSNTSHSVARYDVFLNTAPRPEGQLLSSYHCAILP
jgi:hypothetical protein